MLGEGFLNLSFITTATSSERYWTQIDTEEGREKRGWDDGGLGYLAIKLSGNRANG